MAAHQLMNREIRRRRELPYPRRVRDSLNPLEVIDEFECFRMYRFRKDSVMFITSIIINEIIRPTHRSTPLTPLQQVCCYLRYVSCGTFQCVIGDTMQLSQSSVSRCCADVSRCLAAHSREFIKFPTTAAEVSETKQAFGKIAGFPNVIGCIDGTYVRIKRPSENENDFVNRKGYHSLNVQMICDAKFKVTSLNASWPGAVHDARIWRGSAIKEQFENGSHNGFLLGDSGYPCTSYLLTPYLQPTTPAQQRYNTSLCRTRVQIEQTFGVLKQRFQCLTKGIQSSPTQALNHTIACVVMHNIGLQRKDIVDIDVQVDQIEPAFEFVEPQPNGVVVREHVANTYFGH